MGAQQTTVQFAFAYLIANVSSKAICLHVKQIKAVGAKSCNFPTQSCKLPTDETRVFSQISIVPLNFSKIGKLAAPIFRNFRKKTLKNNI